MRLSAAGKIALAYALFSFLWVWGSDRLFLSLRVLLDPDPWGVKKEGVLCLQTGSTPFTILTQKPAR